MEGTPNDAARQLTNYGIELCAGNNSRSTIRDELEHHVNTSVQEAWREQVLQQALTMLATHPQWMALPNDAVVVPPQSPESAIPKTNTQSDGLSEHIRRLVDAEVRAYIERHEAQQRQQSLTTSSTTIPPTLTPAATSSFSNAALKLKLPDVGKFGGNRRLYRTFRSQMVDKLRTFGEHEPLMGVAYMFNRLEGQAAQVGLSWKNRHPEGSTAEFWEFLDEQYQDPQFEERSRQRLQTIMMKKYGQSLEAFNAEFIQLAFDAAEERNKQNLKTRYLSAIRPDLQDKMVSVDIPEEWDLQTLMARVLKVDVNMRRVKSHVNPTLSFGRQNRKNNHDEMEWEATVKTHASRMEPDTRRRAEWRPQEVIKKWRANNLCIRCGKDGHYANRCRLGPARRPDNVQVKAATTVETSYGLPESDEDSEN